MSNLVTYAEEELKRAEMLDSGDTMSEMMCHDVLELIRTFAKQGHSGHSASLARQLFERLSDYQPLSPLTGADDEWQLVPEHMRGERMMWQNIRYGSLFKDENGIVRDVERNIDNITFPYMPK